MLTVPAPLLLLTVESLTFDEWVSVGCLGRSYDMTWVLRDNDETQKYRARAIFRECELPTSPGCEGIKSQRGTIQKKWLILLAWKETWLAKALVYLIGSRWARQNWRWDWLSGCEHGSSFLLLISIWIKKLWGERWTSTAHRERELWWPALSSDCPSFVNPSCFHSRYVYPCISDMRTWCQPSSRCEMWSVWHICRDLVTRNTGHRVSKLSESPGLVSV